MKKFIAILSIGLFLFAFKANKVEAESFYYCINSPDNNWGRCSESDVSVKCSSAIFFRNCSGVGQTLG